MSALAPARVGWCPGALRPMASGDGLILRVKPRGATLTLAQAWRIAEVSRQHGNGALDLTSRANLQVRGVGEVSLDAAIEALDEVGLIDRDPLSEARRNIVSSPLSGWDASALLDIRPLAAALAMRFADDAILDGLPAKFSIVVDDGGAFGLGGVPADIRFEAFRRHGAAAFAIGLGDERAVGVCQPADLPKVAAALARALVTAHRADPEIRRMCHLVRRDGADAILRRAGLPSHRPHRHHHCEERGDAAAQPGQGRGVAAWPDTRFAGWPGWVASLPSLGRQRNLGDARNDGPGVGRANAVAPVGNSEARATVLGVAAPFGRLAAEQLGGLIAAAEAAGGTELRLTPWRAILIPGLSAKAAARAEALCAAAGLIVDAADPRLAVAACPGAPGCHRGSTPVLDHAARLAAAISPMRRGEIAVHVSGCGKGCAHAGHAPITLVGHDGRYDVVFDGGAFDAPMLRDLSFEDAERCLRTSSMGGLWP